MSKLFTFLKESDTESIRRSHRRRAKEIAVSMSKQTSESKNAPTDTILSGRSVQRTVVSKITGRDAGLSLIPTAGGRPRSSASSIYRRSMEEDTVQNGQYDDDADWFDGYPNRVGGSVITGTDATVAQYCSYIRGIPTEDWALSNRPAVRINVLEYPPVLVKHSDNKDTTWIRLRWVWLYKFLAGRIVMSSNRFTPVVTRPRTIEEVPSNSSASFLKRVSESNLDKLYDLPESIQDVMGLQALLPSAAVCKVMTIPDSNCVRIVTPDEHVPTGFHEILIYDMGQEEWPQVPLSEIGCLRLDWPKDLFAFVGRYQLELEHMRKECRDRFGGSSSGTCPTCDKYIQVNLGKHVALYHLDLAQLWRCPVDWCPVWKGTSQDSVDHMRRAHNTPISVKAGNLARWFPPWTVTREQWHSMSRPSVSHWGAVVPSIPCF